MSEKVKAVNPWEVLAVRRQIKNYQKHGFMKSMKNLYDLRNMKLDKEMLIST